MSMNQLPVVNITIKQVRCHNQHLRDKPLEQQITLVDAIIPEVIQKTLKNINRSHCGHLKKYINLKIIYCLPARRYDQDATSAADHVLVFVRKIITAPRMIINMMAGVV